MTTFRLAAAITAIAVPLALPVGALATAQTFVTPRTPPPPPQSVIHGTFGGGFHHHGFGSGGFILYPETEVVHDVVVVHDAPAEPPAPPPPPPPREPWVMGRTYASLPSGCMKMVEKAASYFYCGGDWYRQVGARAYKAVSKPL